MEKHKLIIQDILNLIDELRKAGKSIFSLCDVLMFQTEEVKKR